ncbi:MAG: class I SAM-dependent methyltransferase [Nitrospirae bacterium]|nr:class I SAM-dependent methyltransferase [Nitrospirota bacterium]
MENICGICNNILSSSAIKKTVKEGKFYSVYFCKHCRIGMTIPVPSGPEILSFYDSENYRTWDGKRFNTVIELLIYISRLQRKKRLEKYFTKGSILDIGCGRGLFLSIMKNRGWSVSGVEFNKETALNISRVYGLNIKSGHPSDWGFSDKSFDIITMNHVLEHLTNPLDMIIECRRLLKKNGLFVCAVPNFESLQAFIGKHLWFHLDIPYHIYHFSEPGLIRLLENNSFRILKIRRFDLEYNPFGWLQTLLNVSGIKKNLLFNILKRPSIRSKLFKDINHWHILFTFMAIPLYVPLSIALSLFESFVLKRGGTVEIFAIKE